VKAGRWLLIFSVAALMIILGGYREILFVNINEQIQFNNGLVQDYRVLDSFSWLQEVSDDKLNALKWSLTLAFSLSFLFLGYFTLRSILKDAEGGRWLLIIYLGTLLLSGAFFIVGKALGQQELGYTLARVFMGALQSPFLLMLMIPARMLVKRM
jgi:hypothetical protein